MATNKTVPTATSVTTFIAALDPAKRKDAKVLVPLMQKATEEKPKLWVPSIIGFGTYHYQYESGGEGDMPGGILTAQGGYRSLYHAGIPGV
jgi:hypothetical protein